MHYLGGNLVVWLSVVTPVYFSAIGIDDWGYLALSWLNGLLCLDMMFHDKRHPYTLMKMTGLFVYVFFILANGMQLACSRNLLTFDLSFSQSDFLLFQLIVFIVLSVYWNTYRFVSNMLIRKTPVIGRESVAVTSDDAKCMADGRLLVLLAICGSGLVLAAFDFDVRALLLRSAADTLLADSSVIKVVVVQQIIRPIAVCCLIAGLIGNVGRRYVTALLILSVVTLFPSGIARNVTAMYWIPVVILFFQRWLQGNRFIILMFVGISILFPMLGAFRWVGGSEHVWKPELFVSMSFDAGQLFMAAVKTGTVSYGYQLLGVLLFFVPRSIWPAKPFGSGYYLAGMYDADYQNVAMPFFAEGYINFGWVGILLFAIVAASGSAILDVRYWSVWMRSGGMLRHGLYLIIIGGSFFIMRGDLMSSFAYLVGAIGVYSIVVMIAKLPHAFQGEVQR